MNTLVRAGVAGIWAVVAAACSLSGSKNSCETNSDCRNGNVCDFSTLTCVTDSMADASVLPADLTGLEMISSYSAGTSIDFPVGLTPAFVEAVGTYEARVSEGTTEVLVRATALDSTALVTINESPVAVGDGINVSLDGDSTEVVVQVRTTGDATATYTVNVLRQGSTDQVAFLRASNPDEEDRFSDAIAISGDTIVAGTTFEDGNGIDEASNAAGDSGAAYVFRRDNDGLWAQEAYLKPSMVGAGFGFAHSVAIHDDVIAIGAWKETDVETDSGAVYVFRRTGSEWNLEARLESENIDRADRFGTSVAVHGDTIVVGAEQEQSNGSSPTNNDFDFSGAAYVFRREGAQWQQEAYLKAFNVERGVRYGQAVAVYGDTVAVGCEREKSTTQGINALPANSDGTRVGAVYVYSRNGGTWTQQAHIKASNAETGDAFGESIALSDNLLVVGAPGEDSGSLGVDGNQVSNTALDSGAAFVFRRSGDTWTQEAYVKPSNTTEADGFGRVAINDNRMVVASYEANTAYLFTNEASTWSETAVLSASNGHPQDYFGYQVGVSSDAIVVASPLQSSGSTGSNGSLVHDCDTDEPNPDCIVYSGAAYVFH